MIEQFEVTEIQNKSRIPYVFDVSDYETNGRTHEQAVKACEYAAKAKFHDIMVAAYGGNVPYCGAKMLHFVDEIIVTNDIKYEIIKREVSA